MNNQRHKGGRPKYSGPMYAQAQQLGADIGITEHGAALFLELSELGYRWNRKQQRYVLYSPVDADTRIDLTLTDAGQEEARAQGSVMLNADREFMKITAKVMTDKSSTDLPGFTIADCWMLLSACQYAQRDVNLAAPTRAWFRTMGDKIEQQIIAKHPDAQLLISLGWDSRFDR